MLKRFARFPMTIRGQITIIILAALVTVVTMGNALESWAKKDYVGLDIETRAQKLEAIAEILNPATADVRQLILASAQAHGWDIWLAPIDTARLFRHSSSEQSTLNALADKMFPPDDSPPLGGWRTFLDGRRVLAARVDDDTIVIVSGVPDSLMTSALVGRGTYYFVSVLVLIVFFFIFAIRVITEPIKHIADAARVSDASDSLPVFEEKGSVEIVALARALNGMQGRIRLMVDTRTRMLRGISHDLRTPLTRLKLRVERLENGGEKDALLSDIDRIERLLGESLNYLRNDYATEATELVDVASIVQTVCSEFTDIGHAVTYTGPNRLAARCRPLSMTRAVTNLCDNAIKFADTVEVRLTDRPDGITISVEDDGPGIPDELIERVKEPFFKADTSRSQSNTGFGLGLSIVSDIARAHNGSLRLGNRSPCGLTATLDIVKIA